MVWQLAIIAGLLAGAVLLASSQAARGALRARLPRSVRYNPHDLRHTALGIGLVLWVVLVQFSALLAPERIPAEPNLLNVARDAALYIGVALLMLGYPRRRTLRQCRTRLGLDWDGQAALIGLQIGVGMFGVARLAQWSLDALQGQSLPQSVLLALNGERLLIGLVFALLTASSEELLWRGAIQPILGRVLTSLAFASVHPQYAWQPEWAIIVALSLVLGWLRWRYGAWAAIAAHGMFNWLPFAFVIF